MQAATWSRFSRELKTIRSFGEKGQAKPAPFFFLEAADRPFVESQAIFQDNSIAAVGSHLDPFELNDLSLRNKRKELCLEKLLELLGSSCSYENFTKELLVLFHESLPCEASSFLERDDAQGCFIFRVVSNPSAEQLLETVVPEGQGIVGFVAQEKIPLVLSEVDESPLHLEQFQEMVKFKAKSLMGIPVIIDGRVCGVVELINRIQEERFSTDDLEFAMWLAQRVGIIWKIRLWWEQTRSIESKKD